MASLPRRYGPSADERALTHLQGEAKKLVPSLQAFRSEAIVGGSSQAETTAVHNDTKPHGREFPPSALPRPTVDPNCGAVERSIQTVDPNCGADHSIKGEDYRSIPKNNGPQRQEDYRSRSIPKNDAPSRGSKSSNLDKKSRSSSRSRSIPKNDGPSRGGGDHAGAREGERSESGVDDDYSGASEDDSIKGKDYRSRSCGNLSEHKERKRSATEVPNPIDVQYAISLRGRELCDAILSGHKDCENRRNPLDGWVAMHVSKTKISESMAKFLRHLVPICPRADYPLGAIVGLMFVERSLSLEELRAECQCDASCDYAKCGEHSQDCAVSPFATGPVCNVISAVLRLPVPILCKGDLNQWLLPSDVRGQIVEQLTSPFPPQAYLVDVRQGERLPRRWRLPWLPC